MTDIKQTKLYHSVNIMMGELGAVGEIDTRNPRVAAVMDALHEIDGGIFNPDTGINSIGKEQWRWVEEMGWHNKTVLESLALIGSEVGEAVNECRGECPTNAFGEELADIIMRTADLAVDHGIDLASEIEKKTLKNQERGTRGRIK